MGNNIMHTFNKQTVSSKTRADVGMVQCVPARYGKTTWRKNRRNKEEGRPMQRVGPARPCNKEEGQSMQTQVINMC